MGRRGARREAERVAALAADQLLRAGSILRRTATTPDLRAVFRTDQGVNDAPYRERWAHDKVVRSTHGVNCTAEAMCRLLAPAKYEERYVIPTTYVAGGGDGTAGPGCSLDHDGGPGMYGPDAMAAFHAPPLPTATGTETGARGSLRGRVNLLNWNRHGRPRGLFPELKAEPPR
ncbi:hypothetical protein [Streptomyces sp. NPDC001480]|uniref:hypothetical protein n=1 Tax=Streptomyces sp. NPDC001480 TaxID=3364577 RepID=UPI0036A24F71